MIWVSVFLGMISAFIISLPYIISQFASAHDLREIWNYPVYILFVTCFAIVIQRFVLDRRPGTRAYDGLADLFIHIHTPSSPDGPLRWFLRGSVSFLMSLFGGFLGPEGSAVEWTHAMALRIRPRSARWFEQRRRSDAAASLSAGISAAFGAPFAAVLLPIELGIGGRTLGCVLSSIAAFLTMKYLSSFFSFQTIALGGAVSEFKYLNFSQWILILVIGLSSGVFGYGVTRFIRYSQESLLDLFQTQTWMRTLAGGILLFLVALVYKSGHATSWTIFENLLWSQKGPGRVSVLLITQVLSLALILSAFGSIGLFWPIFAMGGFFGYLIHHYFHFGMTSDFFMLAPAVLSGATGLFGSILGAPLTGMLIAYEMTGNFHIMIPCFVSGLIAREVRKALKGQALVEKDLEARGMPLIEGRSRSLMDSVFVKDAMISDHEVIHENEPISALHARLLKSKYPFLPIVNSQGIYQGLITSDMIQDAWARQEKTKMGLPLNHLVEAKDLLYSSGLKLATIRPNDRLSASNGMFEDAPCVPVVGEDKRVSGLLFVYNVRLAYDREVARRSLSFETREA